MCRRPHVQEGSTPGPSLLSSGRAAPTRCGATNGGASRTVMSRNCAVSKPPSTSTWRVSRVRWQPAARRDHSGSSRSCQSRSRLPGEACTCSKTCNVPPGRRTLRSSAAAPAGSGTEQSTNAARAESTEASGRGSASATAPTSRVGTGVRRTRRAEWARIEGSGSIAMTSVTPRGRCARSCPGPSPTMRSLPRAPARASALRRP
jgi:hypothetical protein